MGFYGYNSGEQPSPHGFLNDTGLPVGKTVVLTVQAVRRSGPHQKSSSRSRPTLSPLSRELVDTVTGYGSIRSTPDDALVGATTDARKYLSVTTDFGMSAISLSRHLTRNASPGVGSSSSMRRMAVRTCSTSAWTVSAGCSSSDDEAHLRSPQRSRQIRVLWRPADDRWATKRITHGRAHPSSVRLQ